MGYAQQLLHEYLERTETPGDSALDLMHLVQMTMLRDTLSRLEVILHDETVLGPEAVQRVLRCMIYGSPTQAGADYRMAQEQHMADLLLQQATMTLVQDPRSILERLGLPGE